MFCAFYDQNRKSGRRSDKSAQKNDSIFGGNKGVLKTAEKKVKKMKKSVDAGKWNLYNTFLPTVMNTTATEQLGNKSELRKNAERRYVGSIADFIGRRYWLCNFWKKVTERYLGWEFQVSHLLIFLTLNSNKEVKRLSRDERWWDINMRVWSWLRTNAGGMLNTCKSNEKVLRNE